MLDGSVLGGQTEGVKAHGVEDIIALHALETGMDIGGSHGVPVPDVQVPGGIGEHGQGVPLRLGIVPIHPVQVVFSPPPLPLLLYLLGVVISRHAILRYI